MSSSSWKKTYQPSYTEANWREQLRPLTIIWHIAHININSGRNYNELTPSKFKRLFKKNINYVLAINSTLTEDLPIEDHMDKYDSNIARFSLIQCSQEMTASYFPLSVYQIPRYEDLT